jgi:hypothetical protein
MGFFSASSGESGGSPHGARRLVVNDRSYSHSAAKFWSSLIDEVADVFPGCSQVELSAPFASAYDRGYLFPLEPLETEMRRVMIGGRPGSLDEVIGEMEVTGPPASVRARLRKGDELLLDRELPTDMIDAEILPYLVAWLMEWSGIPESLWNQPEVRGVFEAADRLRAKSYDIAFELRREHMCEGLFLQTVRVTPTIRVVV